MLVTSHFAGRVRIRDERLKKDSLLAGVKEALLATPGITGVEANPRVGSLLILYSAAATGLEKIQKIISDFVGSGVEEAAAKVKSTTARITTVIPAKVKKNVVNIGMLASLLLSVAAGILHLKKLHILAGVVFLALFGVHFIERKEYLIT